MQNHVFSMLDYIFLDITQKYNNNFLLHLICVKSTSNERDYYTKTAATKWVQSSCVQLHKIDGHIASRRYDIKSCNTVLIVCDRFAPAKQAAIFPVFSNRVHSVFSQFFLNIISIS